MMVEYKECYRCKSLAENLLKISSYKNEDWEEFSPLELELCETCVRDLSIKNCESCRKKFPDDEIENVENISAGEIIKSYGFSLSLCVECRSKVYRCELCGRSHLGYYHKHHGRKYCAKCYENFFDYCYSCNTRYEKGPEDFIDNIGKGYCSRSCYLSCTVVCEECGERVNSVDSSQVHGSIICTNCYGKLSRILSYNYDRYGLNFITYSKKNGLSVKQDNRLMMGIEYEFEVEKMDLGDFIYLFNKRYRHLQKILDFANLKYDSSLGETGVELDLTPMDLKALNSPQMQEMFDFIENNCRAYDTDGRCGIHISLSSNKFSENQKIGMQNLLVADSHIFRRLQQRNFNDYCDIKLNMYLPIKRRHHSAVCFHKRRVEWRIFKSTTNRTSLMSYMELIDAIARSTKTLIYKKACQLRFVDVYEVIMSNPDRYRNIIKNIVRFRIVDKENPRELVPKSIMKGSYLRGSELEQAFNVVISVLRNESVLKKSTESYPEKMLNKILQGEETDNTPHILTNRGALNEQS